MPLRISLKKSLVQNDSLNHFVPTWSHLLSLVAWLLGVLRWNLGQSYTTPQFFSLLFHFEWKPAVSFITGPKWDPPQLLTGPKWMKWNSISEWLSASLLIGCIKTCYWFIELWCLVVKQRRNSYLSGSYNFCVTEFFFHDDIICSKSIFLSTWLVYIVYELHCTKI